MNTATGHNHQGEDEMRKSAMKVRFLALAATTLALWAMNAGIAFARLPPMRSPL
jgi:hypothetical protein